MANSNLLRTTVTLPEDLLKIAKLASVEEGKTLSQLVREGLKERVLKGKSLPPGKKELLSLMGTIEPRTPMFKNPSGYIRRLREKSDELQDFSD